MSEKIKKIRKRDGRIVDFDRERITNAIFRAAVAVGGKDRRVAELLTDDVVRILEEEFVDEIPSVEDIQDVVERVLIEHGHARTAKAYILYRKQHEELRRIRSTFIEVERIVDDYLNQADWRVRENSNVGYSLSGLMLHIAGSVIANYTLDKVYPMEVADAHRNGDFHLHDLGMGITAYCAGWSLGQLLAEGFNGVPGKVSSKPPSHLDTALLQMANFIGCYDDRTEILTREGWKLFEELSYEDEILTLNPETYELEYQRPTRIFKYDYDGEVISIKTKSIDLLVTPNHRFFVERPSKAGGKLIFRKTFTRADRLRSADRAPRTGYWNCRDQDYFVLPTMEERKGEESSRGRVRHLSEIKIPMDDWLRFLGIYLAEGSIHAGGDGEGKGTNYLIRITQRDPEKRGKIRELLQRLPFKYYETSRDFIILSKQLWTYLKELGKPHEKYIPQEFKELPPKRLSILLEWMLMGDGSYYSRDGLREYVTTSKRLADDVQELFLKVGKSASVLRQEKKTMISPMDVRPHRTKPLYRVREHKSKRSVLKSQKKGEPSRKRTHYKGKVYCVEVPNHVIYVRRNGKPIFCGNSLQNEWAGAQAFNSVDTLLAPFVRKDGLSYRQVKQAIQQFVYNLNIASRWGGQTPFTNITLDLTVPEDLARQHVIIGGRLGDRTYEEYEEEMELINRAFIEVMFEGDMKGRPFTFPIPTYSLTRDFEWDNGVATPLFEMTAKYGLPYFQNFINSNLKPSDVRSMCCRLRLDLTELRRNVTGGLFGSGDKTGSIGVVTINMPRLGYLSRDEDEFFERLEHMMELAKVALEHKREMVTRNMESGILPYTKRYLGTFRNHFSTIGLVGMHEACLNLFGKGIDEEGGKDFAVKVLKFMLKRIATFQEETGHLYNLEATPAEGVSYRLAKIDRQKYPKIITSGERVPYYTNSTQLPANSGLDLIDALRHQEELQTLYTGGTVFHIYLGESLEDGESCKNLMRKVASKTRLPYFTVTPTYSICSEHGFISGERHSCPSCGKETEVYSRVVGYFRPVKNWNAGKQEEFRQRAMYH